MRSSLLTQETVLRALAESVDRRFQAFEECFDKIANRFDALALGANRVRNKDRRRLRDEVAQGQSVNRPMPAHHRRQPTYSDDLEEEEELLNADHKPVRGGSRYGQY